MGVIRIAISAPDGSGMTASFPVDFSTAELQHPSYRADEETVTAFCSALAEKSAAALAAISGSPTASGTLEGAKADGEALRAFKVREGAEIRGNDFATATLVQALSEILSGKPVPALLEDPLSLASRVQEAIASMNPGPEYSGVWCSFDMQDWRMIEHVEEELSDDQREPMRFELRSEAYGPRVTMTRREEEYAFYFEIDRGCAVVRASPAMHDTRVASISVGKDEMQVDIDTGSNSVTLLVGEAIVEAGPGHALTQDDDPDRGV